jgi:acyl-CoA reductase-like NAD-dependent aldehyde dehydrogenase
VSERPPEAAGVPRARMMLQRAHWAATAFADYDAERTRRIVRAVADEAYRNAERYAHWAVKETGMGVAEHKVIKNVACSRGLIEWCGEKDYVSARVLEDDRIVEIPRPAGVVLALTPSTNPIATVYFKVLISLMTRNAVVVSPHPFAREVCTDAAQMLGRAAVAAGAPDGCVQVVEEPTIPLIEALMSDPTTDVILATGGTAVVRAAYRSGNPAMGVGPGNVPVLVDHTADLAQAAERLMDSKAFDNSVLCTNESCVIVEERIADDFERELGRHGGHVLSPEDARAVREKLYPDGRMRTDIVGKDAETLAHEAGIRVPARTRVLVAPFPLVVPEDPLAREKLFPLLGLVRVPDARRGIDAARAMLRIGGAGHSAVIHSRDPKTVMAYSAAVQVLRVAVNVGGSMGSAGITTNLAPTMTIGTGFFGRSSLVENLEPRHLINITRIAYASDPAEPFGDFTGLQPWSAALEAEPVPSQEMPRDVELAREEIRRVVLEELRELVRR